MRVYQIGKMVTVTTKGNSIVLNNEAHFTGTYQQKCTLITKQIFCTSVFLPPAAVVVMGSIQVHLKSVLPFPFVLHEKEVY